MLELKNVSKTFNPGTVNEKKALDGLSVALDEGDLQKAENIGKKLRHGGPFVR